MRRTNWKTVSTLVTAIVIAGCQEHTSTAPAAASDASAALAPEGRPQLGVGDVGSTTNTKTDFTVSPAGGVFTVGGVAVVFPAGSICDPTTSSYGPGTWDQPCQAATSSIRIHAVVRTAKKGVWVDFSPALRFVPSASPSQWVWLYMNNANASAQSLSTFTIKYAKGIGDNGDDESALDSTVRTYFDGSLLFRRIKHFSGYTSSSGRACDPAVETDCYPDTSGGGDIGGGGI